MPLHAVICDDGFMKLWRSSTGLPDGIFSDQNSQFWSIFVGCGMKNVWMFNGLLVLLSPFGIFCGNIFL
jgi:hypothetical protein